MLSLNREPVQVEHAVADHQSTTHTPTHASETTDRETHPNHPHNHPPDHTPDQPIAQPAVPGANSLADGTIQQDEIFAQKITFRDLGIRNTVLRGVEAAGFKHPTAIQAKLIPPILAGRDVIGQAKTGTGKTAAFGLPMYNHLQMGTEFQSLILAPTRELAIQIAAELTELGKYTPIKVAAIYGGQAVAAQASKLRRNPEVIVGTPGRIMDMVERRLIHFRNVRYAVLDEVDRMLDIGFREDIRRILDQTPRNKQTVFVSATLSPEIERLARTFMHEPEKVVAVSGSLTVSLVKQFYCPVQPWDKRRLLRHLLTHEEPAVTVVFCRLKRTCDELVESMRRHGIEALAIHGDLPQSKRNAVMEKLRSGTLAVLVASDLASRGIDVEGITHVINYDLPEDSELYVHRIGRTARAGRGGTAWSFVTPDQGELLTQIEGLINAEIPRLEYPDFEPGPLPDWVTRERQSKERSAAQKVNRLAASVPTLPAAAQQDQKPAPEESHAPNPAAPAAVDPSKFPGGIVPTKLPQRRMMGRVRTRGR